MSTRWKGNQETSLEHFQRGEEKFGEVEGLSANERPLQL